MFAPHHPGKGELLGRHQHRGRVLSRQGWAGPGWEGSLQPGSPEFLGEVAPGATSPLGQAKATRGNNTGCL